MSLIVMLNASDTTILPSIDLWQCAIVFNENNELIEKSTFLVNEMDIDSDDINTIANIMHMKLIISLSNFPWTYFMHA